MRSLLLFAAEPRSNVIAGPDVSGRGNLYSPIFFSYELWTCNFSPWFLSCFSLQCFKEVVNETQISERYWTGTCKL